MHRLIVAFDGLGGSVGSRPTGDQGVAGSTPARLAAFLRGDLIMKYSLPSADSRRAVVSFWRKNVHNAG